MDELTAHYNKFNEDKRLMRRHGQVEYITSMKYIHKYLEILQGENAKDTTLQILDIGAGTGRYAVELAKEGHDVTAVEYVKYNLGRLKQSERGEKRMSGGWQGIFAAGLSGRCKKTKTLCRGYL